MILKFWYKSSNNFSLLVDKPIEMELIKNIWKSDVSTLGKNILIKENA